MKSVTCLGTALSLVVLLTCAASAHSNGTVGDNPRTTGQPVVTVAPHCEVPCGIYADQARFERMLEDAATIEKAIKNINDFVSNMQGPPTAKGVNQTTRWINNKETHATNTQHIVAQYFLTQRIKPDNERYVEQLKAAHAVMVAAMKCKQDADAATAAKLKEAIYNLYRAYEGKEPDFHEHGSDKKG